MIPFLIGLVAGATAGLGVGVWVRDRAYREAEARAERMRRHWDQR